MFNVFEKVVIEQFDYDKFIDLYDYENYVEEYPELENFRNIEAILLKDLFIKEEFQGMGYGRKFVEDLKSKGTPIVLYTVADSEEFWLKMGFDEYSDYIYTHGIKF